MNQARAVRRWTVSILALAAWSCGSVPATPDRGPKARASSPETPPATDIFLVELDTGEMPWRAVGVERVTNRDGYDNQPYFEEAGASLLFASMNDDQTDVFRYRLEAAPVEQLTATAESEYSPTPIPGWPGFSTVRVEIDQTQRLWRFPGSPGAGRGGELVFADIAPVGYHAWIDETTVAMFVLGEPNHLIVADRSTGEAESVATEIGRALHRVPGRRAVSFVDKSDSERWWIVSLDLDTGARRRLIETPAEREDFIWWSARELLIGDGSKLYLFDLDLAQYWQEVADLSEHGIDGITRLARSPTEDRLAVVGERATP